MLDSAGRLQLPGDQRALAGIGRRAKVELVDGGILIRPSEEDRIEVAEAPADAGAEASYRSLYSAEPPPASSSGKPSGKGKWRLRRTKPKT